MKRRTWKTGIILLVLSSMAFLGGCAEKKENDQKNNDIVGDGNYTQTELQALLTDESVTEIKIEGNIGLNRPLVVQGKKTITGTGMLIMVGDAAKSGVATKFPAYAEGSTDILTDWKLKEPELAESRYVLVVKDGAELTLGGNVNLCANYTGENCLVEAGAALTVTEEAVLKQTVNSNIVNYGALTIAGGKLSDTSGYHIVNHGKMSMEGGEITGSGSACAAVYSTGTIDMSNGVIQQAALHGVYLAAGSMEIRGGAVTACEKDGIFVDEGAKLTAVSSALKITKAGRYGVMNLGETVIDSGRFITAKEANVKNAKVGKMTVNGGNFTDSNWAGIYNCGQMEVHGGNISTNKYGGIINTGELVMDGGALYANSGTAQLVNRSGNLKIFGQGVSVTSSKSVGIMNDLAGNAEIFDIIMMDQQAAHIRNWGEMYLHDMTLDTNTTSSAIYNDCGGHLRAERVTIKDSSVHGLYNVAGATAELTDVTMTDLGGRGIQNKGGTVIAKNLVVDKSKGVSVGNDYDKDKGYGDVTIDGLTVKYSYSGAIINQCAGNMKVTNAVIHATEKTAIKIEGGRSYLKYIDLKKTVSTGGGATHAIFLEGGYLSISDSTISNSTGCILQNKAGTVEGDNLVFHNSTNVAISNAYSAKGEQSGNITITGLTVDGSASGNLANACKGKTTLKNATLNTSAKTSISASAGSVDLENVVVNGIAAEKSPCLNIYGGAVVTMSGDKSLITGGIYRAVSVGSSKEEGTFILNGGVISGNGNAKLAQYGGGVNVGQRGRFVMNGGTIENNVGQQGEQLYLATNAQAVFNGGRITGRKENWKETVRLGGNNACLGLSGDGRIEGVVIYNQSSAYIKILGGLVNPVVIQPRYYNARQQVLKADDVQLLAENYKNFNLLDEESIYYVGDNGYLKTKDGVLMVARNQKTGEEYASLQDAVVCAATDGTETVIELLADVKLSEPVIVDGGRKIILTDDGMARTITRGFTSAVNNQNMMFYIHNGTSLEVRGTAAGGLTIQGMGEEDKTNANHYRVVFRVGVKADDGARLILNDGVLITGNYAESSGGVALVYGTVEINGGTIRGNKTAGAGGVFQMATGSAVNMNGGIIEDNYSGGNGGVARMSNRTVFTMNGGIIRGNHSGASGGAIDVMAATVTITGGTISDNTASKSGGNLNIGSSAAKVLVSGGTISGGKVGESGNDVNLCDKGSIDVSDEGALGNVSYGAGSYIRIEGDLSRKPVATISLAEMYEDMTVLTGTAELLKANYEKFELSAAYEGVCVIDEDGLLALLGQNDIVAKTQADGTITEHTTLAAAIQAVPENGTGIITLTADIVLLQKLEFDNRTLTITDDGEKRTISRSSALSDVMITLGNNASLTLEGTAAGGLVLDGGSVSGVNRMITVGASGANTAVLTVKEGATLQNNLAGNFAGSAIYTYGTVNLEGGLIIGNSTASNGTVFVGGNAANPGRLSMTGGTIRGNAANNGGGIAVGNYAAAVINGGTINNNQATGSGGGIQVYNSTLELGGTTVLAENTANTAGGNLNLGNKGAKVTVTDVTISGGMVQGADNDVNIIKDGCLNLSGSAVVGNVFYADKGARINIAGALTKERVAIISLKTAEEDMVILTGTDLTAQNTRFVLSADLQRSYTIGIDGLLHVNVYPVSLIKEGESEGTGYDSLGNAIAAISEGSAGTILLHTDLTLGENLNINRNVTLKDDGTRRTVRRGSGYNGVLITVGNGTALTLEGSTEQEGGLVIDGGSVSGVERMITVGASGANTAVLNVKAGVTLQNNQAGSQGGSAIYIYGTVNMEGGLITGNSTKNNGTICIGGTAAAPGSLFMTGGTISGNSANNGGAISVGNYGKAVIIGGTINNNQATGSGNNGRGGGIQVYNSTLELGGTAVVTENTANTLGGNLNINTKGASASVSGGTISGGKTKDADNDVNIVAGGSINVSADAELGNVSYAGTGTKLHITGVLTKPQVATIKPSEYTVGSTILTGATAELLGQYFGRFTVDDSRYGIDNNGKLISTGGQ